MSAVDESPDWGEAVDETPSGTRPALDRRDFLKLSLPAAAVVGLGSAAVAQTAPPTTTAPQQQGQQRQFPPLGNGEPPALQFQAYPGGTGAYLDRLMRERGVAAFARRPFAIEKWSGPTPSSEEEIAFLPVHRLAALVQSRRISSVQLTDIYLERLKRYDPTLLCAVTIMEGQAREAAQQADAEIRAGRYRGPLHGIPWGVKDLFATKGVPTTWGSEDFKDQVIDEDAAVVVRMREAGAILIAKLATGRFASGDQWYRGRTRNPWNPEQGSSGSSAGPASATAAGCVAFGIGTETRGSIVSPAIRCGLSALRPTFGRISRAGGMVLSWSMDKVGPLCRTVEDCALVFSILHGADENDPSTVTGPFVFERKPDLSKYRIGHDTQAPRPLLDKLTELGAKLVQVGARPGAASSSLGAESAAAFDFYATRSTATPVAAPADSTSGASAGRFTRGRTTTALDYIQSQRRRMIVMREMAEFMKDLDMYVSGQGDVGLTNDTGNPAVVFPYAMTDGERSQPRCTTIIGALFADDRILSVAHAYQQATDWHRRRPALT